MAKSTGKVGRGTTLELAAVGVTPAVWAKVRNVTSINITGRSAEEVDFTTLDSDGGYRELEQGLRDGGSIEFGLHFDPTDPTFVGAETAISDLFESGNKVQFRVNYTGAGFAFGHVGIGFVMNPGDLSIENSAPMAGTATIRVTGPLELVAIP